MTLVYPDLFGKHLLALCSWSSRWISLDCHDSNLLLSDSCGFDFSSAWGWRYSRSFHTSIGSQSILIVAGATASSDLVGSKATSSITDVASSSNVIGSNRGFESITRDYPKVATSLPTLSPHLYSLCRSNKIQLSEKKIRSSITIRRS